MIGIGFQEDKYSVDDALDPPLWTVVPNKVLSLSLSLSLTGSVFITKVQDLIQRGMQKRNGWVSSCPSPGLPGRLPRYHGARLSNEI